MSRTSRGSRDFVNITIPMHTSTLKRMGREFKRLSIVKEHIPPAYGMLIRETQVANELHLGEGAETYTTVLISN